MKMFSHTKFNVKKKLCKFCTFSAICKGNAAVNRITVQHEKFSFAPAFGGSYARLVFV
jgi:hypothetical protein